MIDLRGVVISERAKKNLRRWTVPQFNGCWLWSKDQKNEYGIIKVAPGICISPSKIAYTLAYGPPDPGIQILHKCDTPRCVNPDHLFAGNQRENVLDALRKGRWITHSEGQIKERLLRTTKKIPFEKINELRHLYIDHSLSLGTLARHFRISASMVRDLLINDKRIEAIRNALETN